MGPEIAGIRRDKEIIRGRYIRYCTSLTVMLLARNTEEADLTLATTHTDLRHFSPQDSESTAVVISQVREDKRPRDCGLTLRE